MRIGDPTLVSLDTTDPTARAALIAQAAALPPDKAALLVECADATSVGRSEKLMRTAIASGLGLLVGGALVYWARG